VKSGGSKTLFIALVFYQYIRVEVSGIPWVAGLEVYLQFCRAESTSLSRYG